MKNNINDLALINLSVENLVKQNKEIKEEASKFFPEINGNFDETDQSAKLEMRLDHKLYEFTLIKASLEYYSIDDLCSIVADEFTEIYKEKLQFLLKEHIQKILLNKEMFEKHGSL